MHTHTHTHTRTYMYILQYSNDARKATPFCWLCCLVQSLVPLGDFRRSNK